MGIPILTLCSLIQFALQVNQLHQGSVDVQIKSYWKGFQDARSYWGIVLVQDLRRRPKRVSVNNSLLLSHIMAMKIKRHWGIRYHLEMLINNIPLLPKSRSLHISILITEFLTCAYWMSLQKKPKCENTKILGPFWSSDRFSPPSASINSQSGHTPLFGPWKWLQVILRLGSRTLVAWA